MVTARRPPTRSPVWPTAPPTRCGSGRRTTRRTPATGARGPHPRCRRGRPRAPGGDGHPVAWSGRQPQITVTWARLRPERRPGVRATRSRVDGAVRRWSRRRTSFAFSAQRGQTYQIDVRAVEQGRRRRSWASTTGEIWTAPGPVTDLVGVDDAGEPAAVRRRRAAGPLDRAGGHRRRPAQRLPRQRGRRRPARSWHRQVGRGSTGLAGGATRSTVVAVNARGPPSRRRHRPSATRTVPQPHRSPARRRADSAQVTFTWQPGGDGGSRSPAAGTSVGRAGRDARVDGHRHREPDARGRPAPPARCSPWRSGPSTPRASRSPPAADGGRRRTPPPPTATTPPPTTPPPPDPAGGDRR